MKKNVLLKPLVVICLVLTACSSDGDFANANLQADIDELTSLAQSGSWEISSFIDSGKDETNNFTGYGFSFNSDGSLIADSATNSQSGTWSITIDDSSSDDCNNCSVSQLTDVLTACSGWYVDKLELNDNDLEDKLNGYSFDFSADGTMNVSWNNNTYAGTWIASGSGNNIKVELSISVVEEIEATWTLHEIELENAESKVDLRIGGDDRLRFKNNCTIGNFSGGTSSGNTSDDIDFNIFFASTADFAELSEDWDIISHTASKIELKHASGGNGGTDLLTFEKN